MFSGQRGHVHNECPTYILSHTEVHVVVQSWLVANNISIVVNGYIHNFFYMEHYESTSRLEQRGLSTKGGWIFIKKKLHCYTCHQNIVALLAKQIIAKFPQMVHDVLKQY